MGRFFSACLPRISVARGKPQKMRRSDGRRNLAGADTCRERRARRKVALTRTRSVKNVPRVWAFSRPVPMVSGARDAVNAGAFTALSKLGLRFSPDDVKKCHALACRDPGAGTTAEVPLPLWVTLQPDSALKAKRTRDETRRR